MFLNGGKRYLVQEVPSQFVHNNTVFLSLYSEGELIGTFQAQNASIVDSVIDVTIKSMNNSRIKKEYVKKGGKLSAIFTIADNYRSFESRDVLFFADNIYLGLDGVGIGDYDGPVILPQIALQKGWNGIGIVQNLCLDFRKKIDCWKNNATKLYKFGTISFLGRNYEDEIHEIYRSVPLIGLNSLTKEKTMDSITLASDWQSRIQNPDGNFEYFFNPSIDYYSEDNNLVRQALAGYSMARAYKLTKNEKYLESSERSIGFILSHMKKSNNFAYLTFDRRSDLGMVAITSLAILELPNQEKYDNEIGLFSNFMLSMQRDDGSFKTYYNSNISDDFDFYPGETLLAFARLYKKTGDKKYLYAAERGFNFYRGYYNTTKHKAFVMWQTSAFFEFYQLTGKKEYADFAFELTDWILASQYDEKGAPFPDFAGGFSKGGTPGAWTSVYAEGIADAYKLALILNDKPRAARYAQSLKLAQRFIVQLQFNENSLYYIRDESGAKGGIKESLVSNNLRVDQTSHSILALVKIYGLFYEK